jgi:hypothetical protein
MSLSSPFNQARLGPHRGDFDLSPPDHIRYWEPWPWRVSALLAGQTVLDSKRGIVLWETGMFPGYYYSPGRPPPGPARGAAKRRAQGPRSGGACGPEPAGPRWLASGGAELAGELGTGLLGLAPGCAEPGGDAF